ncbi:MAG: methyltransferase domain-containing protein [Betaproteobacteria bacterium]|nr:methyltransferase domain-containing protein [Betaproteobacteria bacterium]
MANTFFQFKKFIVHQAHTSMKVCTDACLFGAWAASDPQVMNAHKILDIGAGTGLLSLLIAQANNNATITAVEIEPAAANEATSNFKLSPWPDQLNLVHDEALSDGPMFLEKLMFDGMDRPRYVVLKGRKLIISTTSLDLARQALAHLKSGTALKGLVVERVEQSSVRHQG